LCRYSVVDDKDVADSDDEEEELKIPAHWKVADLS
jgi:hypothetical protein